MSKTNNTAIWTESRIARAARLLARKARRLRERGDHAAAEALVAAAAQNVQALRDAGLAPR